VVRFERAIRVRLTALPVYYGWVVVAVCFACSLGIFGAVYSFGVLFDPIVNEFGRSYGGTSVIFSVQSVVTFGSAALLGVGVDRYGVRQLMPVATVLSVSGLVLAGLAPSFLVVVVAYSVVAATGFGIVFVIAYSTTTQWFTERRGFATALATSGTGFGIVLVPPVISALVPHVGWRGGYFALAAGLGTVFFVAIMLLDDSPHDVEGVSTARADPAPRRRTTAFGEQLGTVLRAGRSPPFVLLFVGLLLALAPAYVMLVHGVEHATEAGVGRTVGVVAISTLGGMNVVGKFLVGPLADRVGTLRALSMCAVSTGVGGLAMSQVDAVGPFLAVTAFMGVGYGGIGALLSPAVAEMFGTLDVNALFGLVSLSLAITGSVVPYVAGVGFDAFGTFGPSFLVGGVTAWTAVALFFVADAASVPNRADSGADI